jgi:alginate O-acetyltransferase complex protein AlgI
MLFNSATFAIFFATVYVLYRASGFNRQNWLLLFASYVFYGAWDWRFLSLLMISTGIDFSIGRAMAQSSDQRRRLWLLRVSLFSNLVILGFFKYFNFFIDSANELLSTLGLQTSPVILNVVLPVGISFYTFQTMSYTFDIYRGRLEATRSLRDFAVYVAYFPQLVAGPIERASHLLPIISSPRKIDRQQSLEGLWLISWGLFKKIVIADNAARVVNEVFSSDTPTSGLVAIVGIWAFALQIYGDFSGYTDIARGVSKLLGIELMLNFERPYISTNPSEFWRRWHISLSTWLRDYLYIPLGGNRGTARRTYINLMLVMVLGGLWHGAAWTFVAWGAFHGVLLVSHRLVVERRVSPPAAGRWATIGKQFVMFQLVCVGWLLFRASSGTQVRGFISQILSDWSITPDLGPLLFTLLFCGVLLFGFETWHKGADDPSKAWGWHAGLGPAAVTFTWLAVFVLAPAAGTDFIYFQF